MLHLKMLHLRRVRPATARCVVRLQNGVGICWVRCAVLAFTLCLSPFGSATAASSGGGTAVGQAKARSALGKAPNKPGAGTLVLDVLLANDPDFPPVTETAARAILKAARATLADKLAFDDIEFRMVGETSVAEFIKSTAQESCLARLDPVRVQPGGPFASAIDRSAVEGFLKRWKEQELREFFPESKRAHLTSYAQLAQALVAELDRKLQMIAEFRLANGESLLHKPKRPQRSYVHWICALRAQDRADLILTNEFILYDLGSEPYPHSIFAKNKVGGASLRSPKRQAIRERAVVASTFSMQTSLDYFKELGAEGLSAAEKLRVIGTFIVAHELGHALFKIPDFYDHPQECLMTTKYETGYVSGYHELKRFPGACSACQPYVDARRKVFEAKQARAQGEFLKAIDLLKAAIRATPKHVDGSYLRYIADLSVDVAEIQIELGQSKQAKRWLKAALRIVPAHSRATRLRDAEHVSD